MSDLRSRLKKLMRVTLAGISLMGILKGDAQVSREAEGATGNVARVQMPKTDIRDLLDEKMGQEDRERFEFLLDIMNQTPHGKRLIETLEREDTKLFVVDSFEDERQRGYCIGSKIIQIKRETLYSNRGLWTLAHEGRHAQNKANFWKLPQTPDDMHVLSSIGEGLAEREGFLITTEAMKVNPSIMTEKEYSTLLKNAYNFSAEQCLAKPEQMAQKVFDARVKAKIHVYENQTRRLHSFARLDVISAPEESILEVNPDWNEIVKKMSGGEVQSISQAPLPSWNFIEQVIRETYYHDGSLDKLDLSCAQEHKADLLQGNSFKEEVWRVVDGFLDHLAAERLSPEERAPLADSLKELMPESRLRIFREKGWAMGTMPEFYSDQERNFFQEQTNQGYLNKAIKALNSPAIVQMVGEHDDTLKLTNFSLKAYQRAFFGNEYQHSSNGRDTGSILR